MKSSILKDKNKLLVSTLLVGVVASTIGGGIYLSNKKEAESKSDSTTQEESRQTPSTTNNLDQKETTRDNLTDQVVTQDTTAPQDATNDKLEDVTIQGVLNKEDNSISVSLYGSAGTYSVEKKVDSSWTKLLAEVKYSGSGGLDLSEKIPVSETQRVYRVYRVSNGKTSPAKEILIDRNLLVSNGGISSFPGAL